MVYNIMTCGGFSTNVFGGCSQAWLVLGVLVFIVLVGRRQLQNAGMNYSTIGGFIGMAIGFLVLITITGNPKWSLLSGLVGAIAGGFLLGPLFEGVEGGYE